MKKKITISLSGLPSGGFKPPVEMSLRSADSTREYAAIPDKPLWVEPGEYILSGSYSPIEDGRILHGEIFGFPPFSVRSEISVGEKTSRVKVPVAYDCFALVLDKKIVLKTQIRGFSGAMSEIPLLERKGVIYIRGFFSHPGLDISVVPIKGKAKTYTISNHPDFSEGKILVENGCWYSLYTNFVNQGKIEEL